MFANAVDSSGNPVRPKGKDKDDRPKGKGKGKGKDEGKGKGKDDRPKGKGKDKDDRPECPPGGSHALKVLMVAEKPTIAGTIAHALSGASKPRRRQGQHPRSPVYEFDGNFRGEPASFKVTATFGHVYTLDFGKGYNNWKTTRPDDLFWAPVVQGQDRSSGRHGGGSIPEHLAEEAKGCQALVLWLDCDREGENICFEVIQCAGASLDQARSWDHAYNSRIFRAKFSSLSKQDLMYALNHLIRPNNAMSLSVDARQEIDLRLGVAFSRYQTQYFRDNFSMLSNFLKAVTYGPCQMPTLWFCVHRQCQIESFASKLNWRLQAQLKPGDGIPDITAENTSGKVWDKNEGQILLRKVCAEDAAKVTAVDKRRNDLQRPLPLNTVVLLQKASEQCGLSPGEAMMQAEQLYLKGFLSYPRTETTRYPQYFDKWAVLEALKAPDAPFSRLAHQVADLKIDGRTDGIDVGDHPPITPVRHATERQCKEPSAWELYKLVCRHFLATLSPDCMINEVEVKLDLGGVPMAVISKRQVQGTFNWTHVTGTEEDAGASPARDLHLAAKVYGDLLEVFR